MTTSTEDVLAKLSPESAKDFHECFVEDPKTGQIRFTAKGRAVFRSQFARAGIDIRRICTRDELRAACRRSEHVFVDDLRRMVKGHTELEEVLDTVWPST
jgi:hypothetical protein